MDVNDLIGQKVSLAQYVYRCFGYEGGSGQDDGWWSIVNRTRASDGGLDHVIVIPWGNQLVAAFWPAFKNRRVSGRTLALNAGNGSTSIQRARHDSLVVGRRAK